MKKLFISCPMRGRTDENIKKSMDKLHKIAEAITGEELEVIDSFIEGQDYNNKPLKCLGESINRMQDADYFIGPEDIYDWRGCCAEREIASAYGIRILDLTTYSMMPDVVDIVREKRGIEVNVEPTIAG